MATTAFPRGRGLDGRPLRQGGRGGQAGRRLAGRLTLCRLFVLPASYQRFSDCYKRLCQLQPDVTQRIHDKFVAQLQASVRVSAKEPSRGCWPSGSPGLSAALCGCGLPWPLSVLRRGFALLPVARAGVCACCPPGSCPPRVPSAQGAEATRNRGQPWTGLLRGMRKRPGLCSRVEVTVVSPEGAMSVCVRVRPRHRAGPWRWHPEGLGGLCCPLGTFCP